MFPTTTDLSFPLLPALMVQCFVTRAFKCCGSQLIIHKYRTFVRFPFRITTCEVVVHTFVYVRDVPTGRPFPVVKSPQVEPTGLPRDSRSPTADRRSSTSPNQSGILFGKVTPDLEKSRKHRQRRRGPLSYCSVRRAEHHRSKLFPSLSLAILAVPAGSCCCCFLRLCFEAPLPPPASRPSVVVTMVFEEEAGCHTGRDGGGTRKR